MRISSDLSILISFLASISYKEMKLEASLMLVRSLQIKPALVLLVQYLVNGLRDEACEVKTTPKSCILLHLQIYSTPCVYIWRPDLLGMTRWTPQLWRLNNCIYFLLYLNCHGIFNLGLVTHWRQSSRQWDCLSPFRFTLRILKYGSQNNP